MMRRSFTNSSLILLNVLALSLGVEASKPLVDDDQSALQNHVSKGSSYAACSHSLDNDESLLFFSSQYFDSSEWFSDRAVAWLDTLSHENKVSRLSSLKPSDLLLMPIMPATSYVSAIVSDGLEAVAGYLNPFQSGKTSRSHAKRGTAEISKSLWVSEEGTIKRETLKNKRQRVQALESVSRALRAHVEEVLPDLPPFRVSSLGSLNTLLRASKDMSIPKIDMRAPRLQQLEQSPSFLDHLTPARWGDEFVESLLPALSLGRINQLNLSNNELSGSVLLKTNWDGLQALDLSFNHITAFGRLLQSEVQTLNLRGNRLFAVYQDEQPIITNSSLEVLDVSYNHFSTHGMETMLQAVSRLPQIRVLKVGSKTRGLIDGVCLERSFDASHPNLEELSLEGWHLSSSSIAYVMQLPHLQTLDLRHIEVTKGGLVALERASPMLQVVLSSELVVDEMHARDLMNAQKKGVRIQVRS